MDEQRNEQEGATPRRAWTAEDRAVFGLSLMGGAGIAEALNLVAHGGWGGAAFAAAAAAIVAKSSPDVWAGIKDYLPWSDVQQSVTSLVNDREPGRRSIVDRLTGRNYGGQSDQMDQGNTTDTAQRVRPGAAGPEPKQEPERAASDIPAQFLLDDALDIVRTVNREGYIYFGEGSVDVLASIHLSNMYHVFDVSSSGKGKSNRFRLAMMQLVNTCEVYYINPFAARVKAVSDSRKVEVWSPIFERLANGKPIKTGQEIAALMQALINEIQDRNDREEDGDFSWQMEPVFVFIDELPEVFKRCPEASELLDQLVRTGRQFCVFAYVASQTAAVADIGQSTASQAQYKTRIYGGGDRNSSSRMMKGAIPAEEEEALQTNGAGLTLMLADGLGKRQFVRSPLVTNEALFDYFGLPEFRLSDWLPDMPAGMPRRRSNVIQLGTLPTTPQPRQAAEPTRVSAYAPVSSSNEAQGADTSSAVYDDDESDTGASSAAVAVPGTSYPAPWDEQKAQVFIAVFKALNNVDKSLTALEISTTPRNRDIANDVLKQHGIERKR